MHATQNYVHILAGIMQDSLITQHRLARPSVLSLVDLELQVYHQGQCQSIFLELNMQ